MLKIATFQEESGDFEQQIELNGQLVQIRITYNIRNNRFTLHTFTDQDGNVIKGIKIVPYWLLLEYRKGFLNFEGDLIVLWDSEDAGNDITFDNFGNGWSLIYLEPSEVDIWKDLNGF